MSERLIVHLMKHTRLLTQAGVSCTDAALVERFVASRDESAFTTLVRRHGPMVWAVCRHALPSEADAEDAFQATFLALVRSARQIKRGAAVGAWLHGTAVRVCLVQRRSKRRRLDREARVARAEIAAMESSAWSDELSRAHEAIRSLPRREYEVFVLCVLEGVPQAEAARRLGLKLNSVSGLVARAGKRLRTQFSSSGTLSLGALAVAASCPAAVPAHLLTLTAGMASPSASFPSTIFLLSTTVMESAMRKAMMIVLVTLTLGGGVTAGRWFLATSEAQEPPRETAYRGYYQPNPVQSAQGFPLHSPTWEYKVITSENHHGMEAKLNSLGGAGWELSTTTAVPNSNQIMYVFKRAITTKQTTAARGRFLDAYGKAATNDPTLYQERSASIDTTSGKGSLTVATSIKLKYTSAAEMVRIVQDLFKNQKVTSDAHSNSLLLQGSANEIKEIKELIEKLDTLKAGRDKP